MQMKAPNLSANTAVEGTGQRAGKEPGLVHDGQIASDRLLLYLRCLNFPEVQALGLTLRALMEAQRNTAPGRQNNRVTEAMQALFDLLRDESAAAHNRFANAPPAASQPPVHRRHMVSEKLSPTKTMGGPSAARRTSIFTKRPKDGAGVSA